MMHSFFASLQMSIQMQNTFRIENQLEKFIIRLFYGRIGFTDFYIFLILLNIMSLDIDMIYMYTNDIFRLQSSDMTFGALHYQA